MDDFCQVQLKFAQWLKRRRFFLFRQCIFTIRYHLSLEKGVVLNLNKLDFPSPKDALCQVWLKLAQEDFQIHVFSLFPYYLPLEKGGPFISTFGSLGEDFKILSM